jgi:hypothetical protein
VRSGCGRAGPRKKKKKHRKAAQSDARLFVLTVAAFANRAHARAACKPVPIFSLSRRPPRPLGFISFFVAGIREIGTIIEIDHRESKCPSRIYSGPCGPPTPTKKQTKKERRDAPDRFFGGFHKFRFADGCAGGCRAITSFFFALRILLIESPDRRPPLKSPKSQNHRMKIKKSRRTAANLSVGRYFCLIADSG